MGNNNWVTGADLKTRYTTYHAKIGAGIFYPATQTGFKRKLMLDRYEVDPEDGIVTAAPTLTDQPAPTPVEWSSALAGLPSNLELAPKGTEATELLVDIPSKSDFVVEGYVKGGNGSEEGTTKAGITTVDGKIKFALVSSDTTDSSARLKYYFEGKGWIETDIENVDASVWHKLKIDKSGSRVRFYYDDRFVEEDTCNFSEGGKLGYFAEGATADFSWIGFSNY